jgi:isopentenyl diphosphate isomerase/L-lactate dehydrogenase-like FMN-dependent dehydrogenase
MDDRTKASELAAVAPPPFRNGLENKTGLIRRFPTIAYLRRHAPRHGPRFAFEYLDGGAGADDAGIKRNWAALDAVELVPRYGVTTELPPVDVELFGRRYAAPIGVAPMGGPSIVWPGADEYLAAAAQAARVPYVLGTVGGTTIETAAKIAPDVLWFQLYRMARNDHAIGFDLVARAEAAGVHVLVLTVDVPVRTTRAREVSSGVTTPFRPDLKMLWQIAMSPGWLAAMLRNGIPRFANLRAYTGGDTGIAAVAQFARREVKGAFSWDEIARYRERWKRPLVLKGIMHPDDADKAVSLGVDGLVVSNHGGRQIEALPAAIDALPAVVARVGGRTTVMMDSGIRSGADVTRALALGAQATFAGKAFLWGLGALGSRGPGHVIDLLVDETRAALGQIGARRPAEARNVVIRHPGALRF